MNSFKDAAEIDWDNSPDANEPSWSLQRATTLFNKWVSECTVSRLASSEQATLLIGMIARALEGKDVEYWSPIYKGPLFFSDLSAAIKMLERVRDWFDANGVRYVLRDDVDALLTGLKRDG